MPLPACALVLCILLLSVLDRFLPRLRVTLSSLLSAQSPRFPPPNEQMRARRQQTTSLDPTHRHRCVLVVNRLSHFCARLLALVVR